MRDRYTGRNRKLQLLEQQATRSREKITNIMFLKTNRGSERGREILKEKKSEATESSGEESGKSCMGWFDVQSVQSENRIEKGLEMEKKEDFRCMNYLCKGARYIARAQ